MAPTSCLEATGWLAALVTDRDRSPLRSLRLWLSLLVILSMLSMSMSATSDAEGGGVVVTAAGGRNRRAGARQESRGGGERGWSGLEPHQRATKQNKEAGVGIFSGCRCQRLRIAISFLVSVRASLFAPPPSPLSRTKTVTSDRPGGRWGVWSSDGTRPWPTPCRVCYRRWVF